MRERLVSLNDHLSYLHGEKSKQERELEALKKEKLSLVDKFAKLSLHTKELEEKSNRVAALESDIDELQQEIAMLCTKLKERDDQILNLQSQVLAQCDLAIAKFKESDEFKAMLKAAQDGGITEKFNEWSLLGYYDCLSQKAFLPKKYDFARTTQFARGMTSRGLYSSRAE